jgi:hypothetical protein
MTTTLLQLVMLALAASIHVLNAACDQGNEDVDGRDKPDHDEKGGVHGFRALRCAKPRNDGGAFTSARNDGGQAPY